jgi:hypothetical protein
MFSPLENKILTILDGSMTTREIIKKVYKGKLVPLNDSILISNAIRSINRKSEFYNLDWFIDNSGGGRAGKEFWIQLKK